MHPHAGRELSNNREFKQLVKRLKLLAKGASGLAKNNPSIFALDDKFVEIPTETDCFVRWVWAAWMSEVCAKANASYSGEAIRFDIFKILSFNESFEQAAHTIMDAVEKIPKENRRKK